MTRLISTSRNLLVLVGKLETVFACCILAFIVLMIIVQVGLNAGFGKPITWEQEAGAYALVWLTFVGASVGLKQLRHVRIVSFVSSLPPRWEALVRMVVFAVILWLLYLVLWELTRVIPIESRALTIALPIDVPRSWFFSVPLFITCILMVWTSLHYLIENLILFFNPNTGKIQPLMATENIVSEAGQQ